MKKNSLISLLVILSMLLSFVSVFVSAADAGMTFIDGDFHYKVNTDNTTVTITSIAVAKLTGTVTVPKHVSDGTNTYTVTHLGDAFKNQGTKTAEMTSLILPDTITKFTGTATFYACKGLTSIHLPVGLTGDATGVGYLTKTFYFCSKLESVEIPEGITKCYGTFNSKSGVKEVTITGTSSVDFFAGSGTIEARAWADGTTGISICYPENGAAPTRTSAAGSFSATISTYDNKPISEFVSGDFKYKIIEGTTNVTLTEIAAAKLTGEVTVPETVENDGITYKVTHLGDAFKNQGTKTAEMTSLILPDTITKFMGTATFYGCSGLASIHLPANLTGDITGTGYLTKTFYFCAKLTAVEIPGGITKCYGTFGSRSGVRIVTITGTDEVRFYANQPEGFSDMWAWDEGTTGITIYYPADGIKPTGTSGSFAATVIQLNVDEEEISESPFHIECREVTIQNNKPQINISLKNIDYDGICTAYAAIYKKDYLGGITSQLYDVAHLPIDIKKGETKDIPTFTFEKEFEEDLTYKIIILNENMEPLLNTVERVLADKNADMENYTKMNLFESNSSASWDKPISNNFSVTGWANLTMHDNWNYLPFEAYRSFPEIIESIVTLDFDFSLSNYMEDTRFSVLDNEDIVVGFITKDTHLYLEKPNGDLLVLAEYIPYELSDEEAKTYVKTEFDLKKGMINYVRVNGDVVIQNVPLTKKTNRIDGFDILTGVASEGKIINRQVRINSDHIVNEDFNNQFGILPKDWDYELDGSKTKVYEINSRVPDRFSIDVDTTGGSFKAVRNFDKITGNPVFEIMTLQPKKRDGLKFLLKDGEKTVIEILADGEDFVLKTGRYNEKFYKYQDNVWYGLKAEVDLINSKVNVFVNNKKVLSDIDIDARDYIVDSIEIFASQNNNNFIYDDIKLYKKRIIPDDYVPKPVKPEKDGNFVMGMQVCNLWTEGQYNKAWDYIKSAPNRMPVFGPYDEGNSEMNDWEIKWLLEHGIDYELIWAYPNIKYSTEKGYAPIKPNVVREGHYIYDGFMNAEYSDMMKFAISFENESANYSDKFYDEFFDVYVPYWIEFYFKDDRYLKIDGRPVMGIYVMDKFLNIFGTMGEEDELINQGIAKFRQMCIDAGVGNPYIISHGFGYSETTFDKYSIYDIDCIGLASWPKYEGISWQKSDIKNMAKFGDKYDLDFVATVQPMLDLAAWEQRTGFHASGDEFTDLLEWTRDELPSLITNNSLSKNLLTFLTWNEFGEGHIMMPTKGEGFTYLDSVREVFSGADEHSDVIPVGEQVKRINRMVDSERLVTTVRENPIPYYPDDMDALSVKKGWYFSSDSDYADWETVSGATISRQSGKMIVAASENEPIISLKNIPDINLFDVTYVKIRMKGNTTSCGGYVKWTTDNDNTFDDIKRTYFESKLGNATSVYDYYIPIGKSVKRTGNLTGLRINLGLILDKSQKFQIESIEFLSDKSITNGTKIVYGTKIVPTKNDVIYKNDTLMVPIRDIADIIGAKLGWYAHDNSYILYESLKMSTIFKVRETVAKRENIPFELQEAPYSVSEKINDAVYVPADYVEDALKIKLEWDSKDKKLTVYTDSKHVDMPEGSEIIKADYFNEVNYVGHNFNSYSTKRTVKGESVKVGVNLAYDANLLYKTYFSGINSNDVKYICLKMYSSCEAKMKIFFTLGNSVTLSENLSSVDYNVKPGVNTFCIPVSELKGWTEGTLNYLRIDPLNTSGEFEIDYVALVK